MKDGTESVCVYNTDGCVYKNETHALDLFFAPERKEGWLNLYKGSLDIIYGGSVYTSKDEAEEHKTDKERYIVTIKIEWEE